MKNICFLIILLASFVQAKEISISFDDAPRGDGLYFSGKERAREIIKHLKNHQVDRAAFYVNTNKILKEKDGLERIRYYQKNGHLIGNHTHTHPNIKNITVDEYIADIKTADKLLKEYGLLEKYFRYPYLRRGKDLNEIRRIKKFLDDNNYVDGFVTIDNYDWYMNYLFQNALKNKKTINMGKLRNYYVETLYKSIEFYSELANKSLGKEVKHVLLLHENDLAALFLGDLLAYLKDKGWKIITPEKSYDDPLTSIYPDNILNHGQGRIVSAAIMKGYQGAIRSGYEDEAVLDELFKKYKVIN